MAAPDKINNTQMGSQGGRSELSYRQNFHRKRSKLTGCLARLSERGSRHSFHVHNLMHFALNQGYSI